MSIALIPDRISLAQDAPAALGVAVWADLLRTAPVGLQDGAAYLRSPGMDEALACTVADGRLLLTANMAVIQLAEADLQALAPGRLYVELQWVDAAGAQGRADFEDVRVVPGAGSAFPGAQALGTLFDVAFAAKRGALVTLGLAAGPPGVGLAQAMYAAGLIDAPTTAAMVAWYAGQVGGVTQDQLDQATGAAVADIVDSAPAGWRTLGQVEETLAPEAAGLRALQAATPAALRNASASFNTFAEFAAAAGQGIDASVSAAVLLGRNVQGDHPAVSWRRSAAQPAHQLRVVDGAGGWWEIAEADVDPRYAGAVADAAFFTDATTSAGSPAVSFTTPRFTAADIGKAIGILGAGPPVAASGVLFFLYNPVGNDYVTLNGIKITFVWSAPAGAQVLTGATPDATAANLQAYIHANAASLGVDAAVDFDQLHLTATTAGTAGNAIAVSATCALQTQGYPIFINSPVLAGGLAHGVLASTIQAVASPTSLTLAAPASAAVTGASGEYGTDNTAALQAAISTSGTATPFLAATVPPGTTDAGWGAPGARRVVIRSLGPGSSRFGVLGEVELLTQTALAFEGEGSICALPGFAGAAVLGTASAATAYTPRVTDLQVNCDGFAATGLWLRNTVQARFEGTTRIYGATSQPIRVGYHNIHNYSNEFDHVMAVAGGVFSTNVPVNDPAGAGFVFDRNATDNRIKRLLSIGYRIGYWDKGGENRLIDCHAYGSIKNIGARFDCLNGPYYVQSLFIDTPCLTNPGASSPDVTAGSMCYGVMLNAYGVIEDLHVFLNGTANDPTTGLYSNWQGASRPEVRSAFFSSTNVAVRQFTKLVDGVTLAGRAALRVLSLTAQAGCYTAAGVPAQDDSDHQALLVQELRTADLHANIITGVCRLNGVQTTLSNALRCLRASTALAQNAAGVWQTFAPNQPRLTTAGLLVEPQGATNCIRNSQGAGYTVGTMGAGGVMPANWTALSASGALYDVVGGGTEYGLPYVDVRFHGAASGSIYPTVLFETSTAGTGAAKGDVWTASFYYRLVAGALPGSGVSSMGVDVLEYDSSGTYKGNGVGGYPVTPTAALQRAVYPRTLQQAAVSNVAVGFTFNVANGTAFDFTVRFYVPQLEKGSTASTPIITAGAFGTRAAEAVIFQAPAGTYDLLVSGPSSDTWYSSTAVPAGGWTPAVTMTIKRVVTFRAGFSDAEQAWRSAALASWTEPVTSPGARGPWGYVSTTYTAVAGDKLMADTSAGGFAVNLPATPNFGEEVQLQDPTGSWSANPLTVSPGSNTVQGSATPASLAAGWAGARFIWAGATWLQKSA